MKSLTLDVDYPSYIILNIKYINLVKSTPLTERNYMSERISNIGDKNHNSSVWKSLESSSAKEEKRNKFGRAATAIVAAFSLAAGLPALSACGSSNETKPNSSSSQAIDNKSNNNKVSNKANEGDENQNHYNPHHMTYLLNGQVGGEAKVTFSGKLAEKFDVTYFAKVMEKGAKAAGTGPYDVSRDRSPWVAIGVKNPKKTLYGDDISAIYVTLEDVNNGAGEYNCAFNQENNSNDASVCDTIIGTGNIVYNNVDDPSTLYAYAATAGGFIEGHYETYANNDLKQIVATYENYDPNEYVGEYIHSALKIIKKNPDGNLYMGSEKDWSSIDDNKVAIINIIYSDDNPSTDYVESLLNSEDIKIEFEN